MCLAKGAVQEGLRPTRTLIRVAACGRGQIGLFKNNVPVRVLSLFLFSQLALQLRARTTRTVRWTLVLRPAETNYLGESKTL